MTSIPGRKMGLIQLICLMGMVSTGISSALVSSESIVDNELAAFANEGDNKLPIKKAHNYVSEYKRLPVFNFGIGKRSSDVNGIKVVQPYSFGFGKRRFDEDFASLRERLSYLQRYGNDDEKRVGRAKMYDFGLGKRTVRSPSSKMTRRGRYNFGLGKRSVRSQYEPEYMTPDGEDVANFENPSNDYFEQKMLYDLSNKFVADDEDNFERND